MQVGRRHRTGYILSVVLVVFSVAALTIVISTRTGPLKSYVSSERARLVLVNGFAVSHPGYYVDYFALEFSDFELSPDGGQLPLLVSPRSPYVERRLHAYKTETSIAFHNDGTISIQPIVESETSRTIMRMESGGRDDEPLAPSLDGIGESLLVTAVVRFRSPTPESAIPNEIRGWIDTILFDMRAESGHSPVSWSRATCNSRGFPDCGHAVNPSLFQQFTSWVSLLRDDDTTALQMFGLSLNTLRAHSQAGLVEGLVVTAHPSVLQKLASHKNVREMRLTDVLLSG